MRDRKKCRTGWTLGCDFWIEIGKLPVDDGGILPCYLLRVIRATFAISTKPPNSFGSSGMFRSPSVVGVFRDRSIVTRSNFIPVVSRWSLVLFPCFPIAAHCSGVDGGKPDLMVHASTSKGLSASMVYCFMAIRCGRFGSANVIWSHTTFYN